MARHFVAACAALGFLVAHPGAQDCSSGQVHDDGIPEADVGAFYSGPDGEMTWVSRFTPPQYPYRYNEVCLYLKRFQNPGTLVYEVVIFDDNGPGGDPGTELSATPSSAAALATYRWFTTNVGCNQAINNGSVWIGIRYPSAQAGNELLLGCDESNTHPYSYRTNVDGWNFNGDIGEFTLMIRAQGFAGPAVNASATYRNGSNINPVCYASPAPALQSTWSPQVNHSNYPNATLTVIFLHASPSTGPIIGAGELLMDVSSSRYLKSVKASSGSIDVHSFNIPNAPSLMGIPIATQGLILGPSGPQLCNAFDLVVGC